MLCWRSTTLDHTSWKQASLPKSTFHKVMPALKGWNNNSMEIIKCQGSELALLLVLIIKYSQRPLTTCKFSTETLGCVVDVKYLR